MNMNVYYYIPLIVIYVYVGSFVWGAIDCAAVFTPYGGINCTLQEKVDSKLGSRSGRVPCPTEAHHSISV